MVLGPALVFADIMVAPPPQAGGQFEPTALTWWASCGLWFLYAAALVHLLERYRLAKGGTFGAQGRRGGISSFGGVLMIGVFAWVWLSGMTVGFVAGSINDGFGAARLESATVQDKWVTKGKGCHFHVRVVGPTVESRTVLCMEQAGWSSLEIDAPLPLVVRSSVLGRRVGIALPQGSVPKEVGHE
jgi:hypothetical protein